MPGLPPPAFPLAGPQPACAQAGAGGLIPATGTSTVAAKPTAGLIAGGVLGALLLGAIGLKYRTHGGLNCFWGRVLALLIAAAAAYQATTSYTLYNENNCSSADSASSGSSADSACPSSMDVMGLATVVLFHLFLNLPFLFATKAREKKLYATFSLYQQATATTVL